LTDDSPRLTARLIEPHIFLVNLKKADDQVRLTS
jgi:hypothetical protein